MSQEKLPKGLEKKSGPKTQTAKRAPAKSVRERAVPALRATPDSVVPAERYWEGIGRRKTAVARVRIFTRGEKTVTINGKPLADYFPLPRLQKIASEALDIMNSGDRFRVSAKVSGGGNVAQAEAVRHGMARALVLFNIDFRKRLKRAGFLTRDARMKERKKFGLKKARRAPQWAKR